MFRILLLSIVFSLAVGQNVALLCRTWCDARSVAATECYHESSFATQSVASDESCGTVDVAATAILGEDVRRNISSRDANQAILAAHSQLAQLTTDTRPGEQAGREWSLENRPLSTALRI